MFNTGLHFFRAEAGRKRCSFPGATRRGALAPWCTADPGSIRAVGPGSASRHFVPRRVRDTSPVATVHMKLQVVRFDMAELEAVAKG